MKVEFALAQAIGGRDTQEDCCAIVTGHSVLKSFEGPSYCDAAEPPILCVMCDGMGGHASGEVASRLAVSAMVETALAGQICSQAFDRILQSGCVSANEAIARTSRSCPETAGMGTTIVAIGIDNGLMHWVSIGDSHLLLLTRGQLYKLNQDHSMRPAIDRMVERHIISADDASRHPQRNVLRSVLMGEEVALVDIGFGGWPLHRGDAIILASDGLDVLGVRDVKRCFDRWRFDSADTIARHLVEHACAVGGSRQDNTSVIVARVL
ncbi:protein phosphatase 2C domain-containing protein [Rhodopseudomonas palustris]|nr:protein phosphatase 2C domain-containing protein [Rhodopseudomonas palustris]